MRGNHEKHTELLIRIKNQTILRIPWLHSHDEYFRVAGRTTFYESVEQMQNDLDVYIDCYNARRAYRVRSMDGRTPKTVFFAGILLSDFRKGA